MQGKSLFQSGVCFQLAVSSNCRCIASWKHTPLKQLASLSLDPSESRESGWRLMLLLEYFRRSRRIVVVDKQLLLSFEIKKWWNSNLIAKFIRHYL